MTVLTTILCGVIVLGLLIIIHEGGHFLSARAFGVRVSEFMVGLPGPNIGFTRGETKFGLTAIPLGGYARVCGMDTGKLSPHLKSVMAAVYEYGKLSPAEVASICQISEDDAFDALEQLVEWGSIVEPAKRDKSEMYATPGFKATRRLVKKAQKEGRTDCVSVPAGSARPIENIDEFYEHELQQQYRHLPFWKRSVILVAGPLANLLFTILAFVIIYSLLGFNVTNNETGEITHMTVNPLKSLMAGFTYIGMVFNAILGLFNPQTAAETVSNSTSIVGIAVMSVDYFSAGIQDALFFMAMISVSLGLMNLLPLPPLDGGKFAIEIIQKISKRHIPTRVVNNISVVCMLLFTGLFLVMLNQDIQRFILGNW